MKKNIFYVAIYQILILIVPFVTLPYVSRVLKPEGVGTYAFTNSIAMYFCLFCILGIQLYGRREIAKYRDDKCRLSSTFYQIYLVQIISSILSICMYFLFVSQSEYKISLLFQFPLLLSYALDISWFYFGLEQVKFTVTRNFFLKIMSLFLVFVLVKESNDVNIYIVINSASMLLSQLVLWIGIRRFITKPHKNFFEGRFLKKRLGESFKLFIPVLSVQLYVIVGKTLLGYFSTQTQVGLFENADKLTRIPITIISAIGQVMLPRMTYLFSKNLTSEFTLVIKKSFIAIMIFSIGCFFGIIAVSDKLVPVFLGSDFQSAVVIVRVLAPIILYVSWGNIFRMQYILPKGLDSLYTKTVIYACVLNVVLNILLTPHLGAVGAAVSSCVSEGMICFYQSFYLRKEFSPIEYLKSIQIYIISGVIMMLSILFIGKNMNVSAISIFFEVLLGILIYVFFIICLEKFTKKEFVIMEIRKGLKK